MRTLIAFILLVLLSSTAFALEKMYQKEWCDSVGGQMEVVLDDGARVDCLTRDYAIEFDFCKKWAEGAGQALYYGIMTGKKPGVVLICGPNDNVYIARFKTVAKKHKIMMWKMEVDE